MVYRVSRFFFTRHPYNRLWSVYLDKELLPAACEKPVSFVEFLTDQGVVLENDDRHLMPVSSV